MTSRLVALILALVAYLVGSVLLAIREHFDPRRS